MELHFLGRTYTASTNQITTVPSVYTACFRGQHYNLRVPVASSNARLDNFLFAASIRKYRGVAYSNPI